MPDKGPGESERAIKRAAALHRRARDAAYAYNFGRARARLRDALDVLDAARPVGGFELAAMRIRVMVSLAYAETEGGPIGIGLRRLDAAEELLNTLEDGPHRAELFGLVREQRGFLLIRVGRIEEGLEVLDVAADSLERSLADSVGDSTVLATLYLNRSLAHIELGQPSAATAELTRCIELAGRDDVHSTVGIKARHNLGYVAYMTGDIPTALRHYEEAAASCRAQAPGMLPVIRLDQARALLAAGLGQEAARHLDEALPRLRRQRGTQDVAEAEVARAAAALLVGDLALARRRARSAERTLLRRGNIRWAAIAALAALRADTATALRRRSVPPALPIDAVKLADHLRALLLEDETALALMLAVRLELCRGDPAAAAVLLDQVPRPRATSPVDHRMLLRLCRAELAVAEGDRRRALAEARAGLVELGKARDRMGGLELVCGTAIHGAELGVLATRLVLSGPATNARQLFGWLERTRAQVYRYEPLPAIDDPVIAEKVVELRSLRRAVQLDRLAGRPVRRQAAHVAALERDVLRQGWYASPWGRPRPVATFVEVTDALGDRAVVTFAASGDDLVAVVVTASHARMVRLGSASVAAEWAARLHADLDALAPDRLPEPMAAVVATSARGNADALDARLISPLSTLLGSRELVIVPTGPLYAVPWGSLPSLRGWPLVVAPSATAWLAATRDPPTGSRVVMARGPLLTEAIAEERPLRSIYPGATRLAGQEATVANVLSALDGSGIAHLAAHGAHEPTNAMFSRLELADGPLFAHELSRLGQPPRHVVLAACELAMNHIRPGDEALGFAGAMLASGVRTVVAATSRVGDAAAADAMISYHQRLAAGTRPAVALAESVAADPFRRPFICLGAG